MSLQQQQQQPQARPLAPAAAWPRDADFVAMSDLEFERCLDASPPPSGRAEPGPKYRTVTLRLRGVRTCRPTRRSTTSA